MLSLLSAVPWYGPFALQQSNMISVTPRVPVCAGFSIQEEQIIFRRWLRVAEAFRIAIASREPGWGMPR